MARPSSDRSPAPQLLGGPAGGAALHGLRSLLQGPGKTKEPPASCLLKEKERKAAGGSGSEDVGGLLGVSGRPRSGPGPGALLASLLWERPLPFGDVDDVDLDAFLLEHGLPPSPPDPGPPAPRAALAPGAAAPSCSSGSSSPAQSSSSSPAPTPTPASPRLSPGGHVLGRRAPGAGASSGSQRAGPVPRDTPSPVDPESVEVLMTFDPDPADLALSSVPGQDTFDPRKHRFSEEELKPQPIMKKARKIQVPEEQKDEKYWSRRYKNNEAAKRSRDARRLKENQISVRAAFLEKENALLRQEVVAVRQELSHYRAVLSRYQAQHGAL
ncbi:D site-binding protein isoform X3 [Monodelphis domestica]|uniref:D site-binding protein isoform X3 n=1 Tax=Monodelphis domestica TaxID=13616 RepID=UPI0024E20637|nr:D site-binding protein isoform X3 [Monodelphis domestica]